MSLKCDSCLRKEHEVSAFDDKMPKRIFLIQVTETRQTKITQSEASYFALPSKICVVTEVKKDAISGKYGMCDGKQELHTIFLV